MKDDAGLAAEVLSGNTEEFGRIVDRYRDAVFGIAFARVGSLHLHEQELLYAPLRPGPITGDLCMAERAK